MAWPTARRSRSGPASASQTTGQWGQQQRWFRSSWAPRARPLSGRRPRTTWAQPGAGERHGAPGRGGRGLPRGPQGEDPRARPAPVGHDPEQPGQRACDAWGANGGGDRSKLKEARKAIAAAFDVFMQAGQEHYRAYFEARLSKIDRKIADLKQPPGVIEHPMATSTRPRRSSMRPGRRSSWQRGGTPAKTFSGVRLTCDIALAAAGCWRGWCRAWPDA